MLNRKRYIVHGWQDTFAAVEATTADGLKVTAQIPAVVIELVPEDGKGQTVTLTERITTKEGAEFLAATFPIGGLVEDAGWTLISAPEAKG